MLRIRKKGSRTVASCFPRRHTLVICRLLHPRLPATAGESAVRPRASVSCWQGGIRGKGGDRCGTVPLLILISPCDRWSTPEQGTRNGHKDHSPVCSATRGDPTPETNLAEEQIAIRVMARLAQQRGYSYFRPRVPHIPGVRRLPCRWRFIRDSRASSSQISYVNASALIYKSKTLNAGRQQRILSSFTAPRSDVPTLVLLEDHGPSVARR
jgi:hypothetical protein